MKKMCVCFGIVFLAMMLMGGLSIAGTAVTIEGTVNNDYQLVADDGKVYEISSDEEYIEVAEKLSEEIDKRVSVKGEVETDDDGTKTINVSSYRTIEAKQAE